MTELYYFHDATCGIKARLAMFEKGVEFEPRVLDRFELTGAEYLAINPKGVVPTLVHEGVRIFESSIICLYVDDAFIGPALKPPAALDRARMYTWLQKIDEEYFKGLGSTTFGLSVRHQIVKRYPDSASLEAYFQGIRVEEYRRRRRSIVEHGLEAPEVHDGLRVLARMIDELNLALSAGDFAAGDEYSLADACITPFVMRLDALGLEQMWADSPRVADWWTRMRARESYARLLQESFPDTYFRDMRDRVGNVWPRVEQILSQETRNP